MKVLNVYLKVRDLPPKFVKLRCRVETFALDVLNMAGIFPKLNMYKVKPHYFLLYKILTKLWDLGIPYLAKILWRIREKVIDPDFFIIELW